MLTKLDLDKIKKIVARKTIHLATRKELKVAIKRLVTRKEFEAEIRKLVTRDEFEAAIKSLPSRDEFFGWMDKLMNELKTHREERAAMKFRFDNHEERIVNLETTHPGGAHPAS